jgi:hypothetical protein
MMNLTEHDIVQLAKIKLFTKVKVLSPEHSEYIQKLAFEAGFQWKLHHKNIVVLPEQDKFLYFSFNSYCDRKLITRGNDPLFSNRSSSREIFIDLPITEVKPPFKFKNANVSIVRQWLKDHGYGFEYPSLDIMEWNIEDEFGFVGTEGYFSTSNKHSYFNKQDYPEVLITFNMCIESVTFKRSKELENLKSELEKARKVVQEIESKLKEINL